MSNSSLVFNKVVHKDANRIIYTEGVGIGTTVTVEKLHLQGNMFIQGDLIPSSCNVYDIGSSNLRFKDLYLSGNTIDLGGTRISRSANSGQLIVSTPSGQPAAISANTITVSSSNLVANLNAQYLNGKEESYYTNIDNITAGNLAVIYGGTGAQFVTGSGSNVLSASPTLTGTVQAVNLTASGTVAANAITVSSSNLITNLNADRLDNQEGSFYQNATNINNGVLNPLYGGTGSTTVTGTGSNVLSDSPTLTGTVQAANLTASGTVAANAFQVTSSNLVTNLNVQYLNSQEGSFYTNATNINDGALNPLYGGTGAQFVTGSGSNVLSASPTLTGTVQAANLTASGTVAANSVQVTSSNLVTNLNADLLDNQEGSFYQNATNINTGALNPLYGGTGAQFVTGTGSNVLSASPTLTGTALVENITASGTVAANAFQVTSSNLVTNLNVQYLNSQEGSFYQNVNNMNAGTLPVARGGTGQSSLTANKILVGNNTSDILQPANLHWDSGTNRLGINNQFPSNALDVVGNAYVSGTITASNLSIIGDFVTMNTVTSNTEQMVINNTGTGPALRVIQTGNTPLAEFFDSESGSAMFIDNNGLIGFSTNVPLAKLYVLETGSVDAFRVDDQVSDSTPFIIKADGLVGIGKTNPGTALDVNGTITATAFSGPLSGTATNATNVNAVADTSTTTPEFITFVGSATGNTPINTNNGQLTFIPSSGNVGIGTTFGRQKLDVVGNIQVSGSVTSGAITSTSINTGANDITTRNLIVGTGINKGTVTYPTDTTATFTIPNTAGNADFVMTTGNQSIGGLKVFSSGVGIGTTVARDALDIIGNARLSGSLTATGFIGTLSGTATGLAGNPNITVGSINLTNTIFNTIQLSGGGGIRVDGSSEVSAISIGGNGIFGIDAPNVTWGRFVVRDAGNVGISTTNPQERLHVEGNIALSGAARFVGTRTNDNLSLRTNNTDRITVLTDGSVGIGTTIPLFRFHVKNTTAKTSDGSLASFETSDSSPIRLVFGQIGSATATSQGVWIDVTESGVSDDRQLVLQRYGGSVGIGTASPQERLHVEGNIALSGAARFVGTRTNHNLSLRTNNSDRITIDTNGNVGIGNITPVTRLDVSGPVSTSAIYQNIYYSDEWRFKNSSGYGLGITLSQNDGYIYIANTTNQSSGANSTASIINRVVIDNNGNVGIGSATPTQILDVNGGIFGRNLTITNTSVAATRGTYKVINEFNNDGNDRWWQLCTLQKSLNNRFLFINGNFSRVDGSCHIDFKLHTHTYIPGYSITSELTTLRYDSDIIVYDNITTGNLEVYIKAVSYGEFNFSCFYLVNNNIFREQPNWTITAPIESASYIKIYSVLLNNNITKTISGNVGIGVNNGQSPIHTLQTWGRIGGTVLHLSNNNLETGNFGVRLAGIDNGINGHDFRIQGRTTATGTFTDLLSVKSGGSVGIATTSPQELLHVEGNIALSGAARFVGTRTNHNLSLRTNNTDRITILSNGNVGIGSATPVDRLDVAGTIVCQGDLKQTGIIYMNGTQNTTRGIEWYYDSGSNRYGMCQDTNGITRIFTATAWAPATIRLCGATGNTTFIDYLTVQQSSGNVGIATTNPSEKLHVEGTVRSTGYNIASTSVIDSNRNIRANNTFVLNDGTSAFRFVVSGGSSFIQSGAATETSDSKAPIRFTSWFGGTEWMRITTDGRVGIGTNAPIAPLHVMSDGIFYDAQFQGVGGRVRGYVHPGAVGGLKLESRQSNGTYIDTMNLSDSGLVGIGTTNPQERLHIEGNIALSGAARFVGTRTNHNLSLRTNNTDRITILNDGKVGINTTAPATTLDVNGIATFRNTINKSSLGKLFFVNLENETIGINLYKTRTTAYVVVNGAISQITDGSILPPDGVDDIVMQLTQTGGGAESYAIFHTITFSQAGTITGSMYVRTNISSGVEMFLFKNDVIIGAPGGVISANTWTRFSVTTTVNPGDYVYLRVDNNTNGNTSVIVYYTGLKIEYGSTATRWIPVGVNASNAVLAPSIYSNLLQVNSLIASSSQNPVFTASAITGNVGIGTATPIELLNVEGNIALSGAARFVGSRTNHNLSIRTNNTDRITINTSGNVGIGTTAPAATLHVAGNCIIDGVSATGGTVTEVGGYRIHTFTSSGTFTVTNGGTVEYLVVAGGGGGGLGNNNGGGGGGAGGYITSSLEVSTQSYNVTVGAGGAGRSVHADGGSGSNSMFGSITAAGGGGGAGTSLPLGSARAGVAGGSGGGASYWESGTASGGAGNVPNTTPSQGNNGGGISSGLNAGRAGAGGGGAGAAAANVTTIGVGTAGGNGVASSITGTSIIRAGGGGGCGDSVFSASGGAGGGGAGLFNGVAGSGTINTGGGGGGSLATGSSGNGGSGIVIIRYLISTQSSLHVNGNITSSGTVSSATGFMFRNLLINGGFDVWQRGTSATISGDGYHTVDRWRHLMFQTGTVTYSQIDISGTASAPGATYALRCQRATGTNLWAILQACEKSVLNWVRGKTVTYSIYLRKGSALTTDLRIEVYSNLTESVNYGAVDYNQLVVSNASLSSSAFTRWNISLVVPINTTAQSIIVSVVTVSSQAGGANVHFDVAMAQLEVGDIATPFEYRPVSVELAMCQRYYYAHNYSYKMYTDSFAHTFYPLPVKMRVSPTITKTVTAGSGIDITIMEDTVSKNQTLHFYNSSSGPGTRGENGTVYLNAEL
jgi:hypothetical protein